MTTALKEELEGFLQKETPNGSSTISAGCRDTDICDIHNTTMSLNSTSLPESTSTPNTVSSNSSLLGLAVGLPIIFVVFLLVGIAVLFWFRRRKSVDIELSNKLKNQDKSHDDHSRESPYSGYGGGLQPAPQSPIYENFQSGQSNLHEFQRSDVESQDTHRAHQEYLQCDPHDAIYSNDPALFHPDQADISEDVYIMPDA